MGRRWLVLVTTGACAIGGGGCGRDLGRSLSASGGGAGGRRLSRPPSALCRRRCAAVGSRWRPRSRSLPSRRGDRSRGARRSGQTCAGRRRCRPTEAGWPPGRQRARCASSIRRAGARSPSSRHQSARSMRSPSPDGRQLATLTQETGILALWRSEDGMFLQSFAGSPASTIYTTATQVAFSSDGKLLMSSLGTQIVLDGANTSGAGLDSDAFLTLFGGGTTLQLRFVGVDQRVFRDLRYAVGNSPGSVRLSVIDLPTHSQTTLSRTVRSRSERARRLG